MGTTACILLGPRTGVYLEDGTYVSVRASSSNTILGTFLLYWVGFWVHLPPSPLHLY